MFQMMGVFAEFERSIIQERVRAGLKRASILPLFSGSAALSAQAPASREAQGWRGLR